MLPEGWKIFRGEEIAQKITKGQSPKWQGFEYQKDGAIFITSENVRDGFLDISRGCYALWESRLATFLSMKPAKAMVCIAA
ncbi:restriction endonuclease subunit S domain-containing protein, partial [Acetobacter cerevisiae]